MQAFNDDEFYTVDQVAQRMKITRDAIYKWIKNGRIKALRAGRVYRILGKNLNEFLELKKA